jgi:hypothetical protein
MVFFRPLLAITVLAYVLAAPVEVKRSLPGVVSTATAKTYLAACKLPPNSLDERVSLVLPVTVATESNSPAYDRDLFNTWITSES